MLNCHHGTNPIWKVGLFALFTSVVTVGAISLASVGQREPEAPVHAVIQKIAEKALIKGVRSAKGQGGFAVVADANTGEILAAAHVHQEKGRLEPDSNREFLKDLNNPWSASKTFLIAKAIDQGIVKPGDIIDCGNGTYEWNGVTFHDWKGTGFGRVSVDRILAQSSNIGGLKIANKVGADTLSTIDQFGFGENSVASDYPGAAKGTFPMNRESLSLMMAVGQDDFRVSPIEMVQAYSALVNGGKLLKPVPYQASQKSIVVRQIISPVTSETMRAMLHDVVKLGTGQKAKTRSYSTGGKTASAPRIIGDEGPSAYAPIASFTGFAPVKDPRIVLYVGVENVPESHGSTQAAPIFSQIVEASLRELKVAPDL